MSSSRGTGQRRSGVQVVYEELHARITRGEIQPGTRLYEPKLARSLEVSRTPLREALRMLSAEGLVEQQPTGGSIVAPLDLDQATELYEVRAVLEGLVARQAAERITDRQVDDLTRQVELMERLVDLEREVLRLGKDFHASLEDIAQNHHCSTLLHQLRGHINRYRALSTHKTGRTHAAVAEHRHILQTLLSRSPEEAETAMRSHVLSGAKTLYQALEREPSPVRRRS